MPIIFSPLETLLLNNPKLPIIMKFRYTLLVQLLLIPAIAGFTIQAHAQNDDSWENDDAWEDDESWDSGDDYNYDDPWGEPAEQDREKTEAQKYRESIENACESKYAYRTRAKSELHPYTYSSGKTSMIKLKRKPYFESFVVPIYFDYQHSIVFNREGMVEKTAIKVYDGPRNDKNRQLLFDGGKDDEISTFELASDYEKSKIYIEYLVPPSHPEKRDITQKGCIVFVMGYLDEAAEDYKESTAGN